MILKKTESISKGFRFLVSRDLKCVGVWHVVSAVHIGAGALEDTKWVIEGSHIDSERLSLGFAHSNIES